MIWDRCNRHPVVCTPNGPLKTPPGANWYRCTNKEDRQNVWTRTFKKNFSKQKRVSAQWMFKFWNYSHLTRTPTAAANASSRIFLCRASCTHCSLFVLFSAWNHHWQGPNLIPKACLHNKEKCFLRNILVSDQVWISNTRDQLICTN